MKEHDFEPVRGLPGELPDGERLLWQGAPDWLALGRRAFHMQSVAAYFSVLMIWRGVAEGSLAAALGLLPFALIALALLAGLAFMTARTTVYTITTKRVVMRFGVALPKAINIPFTIIASADHRAYGDKSGDIALSLAPSSHINYFLLWPHARPLRLARPQPTLRAVAEGAAVAAVLARALKGELVESRTAQAKAEEPAGADVLCPA